MTGGGRASQGRVLGNGNATDTSAVERHGAAVAHAGLAQIEGLALGQRRGASAISGELRQVIRCKNRGESMHNLARKICIYIHKYIHTYIRTYIDKYILT